MSAMRRRQVSLHLDAMRITRIALGSANLVYVVVATKELKYPNGMSKIAYVGSSKKGVWRMAQSAAYWAAAILRKRGVDSIHVHVVACRHLQKQKTWQKLERAFLLTFRKMFGAVPMCNSQGKKIIERDEFAYFTPSGIERVIRELS